MRGRQKQAPPCLNEDHEMLSSRMPLLAAAALIFSCFSSTLAYCGNPAVLAHPARDASAEGVSVRHRPGAQAPRSYSISVAQRQLKAEIAAGAPYSSVVTPNVGSPEWKRDEAETARREKELARKLNGICRGC